MKTKCRKLNVDECRKKATIQQQKKVQKKTELHMNTCWNDRKAKSQMAALACTVSSTSLQTV